MAVATWPQVHGHRGCRGLMPENTIEACLKAIDLGVDALELDVVITGDMQVLVSHEAYFSSEFCLLPDDSIIIPSQEQNHNIFRLPYSQIRQFDCGIKPHPRFPAQKKMPAHKPLLRDLILAVEDYTHTHKLPPVGYNIEIKSFPAGDNTFHPDPEVFVDLLMQVLLDYNITNRWMLQSFDVRPLQLLHHRYPHISLGLLVEDELPAEHHLQELGFYPFAYNPYYKLITQELLDFSRSKNMKVCAWTVNTPEIIQDLLDMGVDAIITDYPDLAVGVCQNYKKGATNP